MGRITGIEWTDSTWNPIRGCTRVSEGCRNCYAESVAARFSGAGAPYAGLAIYKDGEPRWTGELRFVEKHLDDPLRWKEPKNIFVNSMSDLFHPAVTFEWLAAIFDVMARAKQHTYQILTKRPQRMLETLLAGGDPCLAETFEKTYSQRWPPKNWWFGVSVEDQKTGNERIPILAKCPAGTKFVSYEPALGPLDFAIAAGDPVSLAAIDWVICGGESGSHARPMEAQWARDVRDLCVNLGTPFFFKQWGEWAPMPNSLHSGGCPVMLRVGKKRAGAVLDGREWKEYPR